MADNAPRSGDALAQSESTSYLTRHLTSNSFTSRRPAKSVELSKALELIRFVGCKNHHQVLAALRMLIPYIETEQAATLGRLDLRDTVHDFAVDGMCSPRPSSHSQVDHVLCLVVEMYVESKLASRSKKAKDSDRGRHEVGQKLQKIEDEFSDQSPILRAFEVVRLRYNLPPRPHTNISISAPIPDYQCSKPGGPTDFSRSASFATLSEESRDILSPRSDIFSSYGFGRARGHRVSNVEDKTTEGVVPLSDKSRSFGAETPQDIERSPTSSPRLPFSEACPENDPQFQLFWKDEKLTHHAPQVINYSLPRGFSQSAERTTRKTSPWKDRPVSAAHDLWDILDPFSFHALTPSATPPSASSTSGNGESNPNDTPTLEWELEAFTSGSQRTRSQLQPDTSTAFTGQIHTSPTAPLRLDLPTQSTDRRTFQNERPLLADMQKHPGSSTSNRSSNDSHLLTPHEGILLLPRSSEVHVKSARRESAVWPGNGESGIGQENNETCLVYS